MKTLSTATLKKNKAQGIYTVMTKALQLSVGDYYLCAQSTNAAQGGNAYYNVMLNTSMSMFSDNSECAIDMPELSDSGLNAQDDLSLGQYAANSDALADLEGISALQDLTTLA